MYKKMARAALPFVLLAAAAAATLCMACYVPPITIKL